MSKAWKAAEREVARFFGGQRRIRVRYDESVGDIIHPVYSFEVKYGKQIPHYLRITVPTVLTIKGEFGQCRNILQAPKFKQERTKRKGRECTSKVEFGQVALGMSKVELGQSNLRYLAAPSAYLVVGTLKVKDALIYMRRTLTSAKFLSDSMAQARRYNPNLIPVVCVKSKGQRGFTALIKID